MADIAVSEYVGIGHPDKFCDYVADYILERLTEIYPRARTAIEVLATKGLIVVGGEYYLDTTVKRSEVRAWVMACVKYVYGDKATKDLEVVVRLKKQSKNIAKALFWHGKVTCADQGCVYGYADKSNSSMVPLVHYIGGEINTTMQSLVDKYKKMLGSDYKLIVVLGKNGFNKVKVSVHQKTKMALREIKDELDRGVAQIFNAVGLNPPFNGVMVNSGGDFHIGGLDADTGTTNRKLQMDTYGCEVPHGGGGLSGKDMTKPDRLLSYWARYIAMHAVASGLCTTCLVKIAYYYGSQVISDISITTDTRGRHLDEALKEVFTWRYWDIYTRLFRENLQYSYAAVSGHFLTATAGGDPWGIIDPNLINEINNKIEEKESMEKMKPNLREDIQAIETAIT